MANYFISSYYSFLACPRKYLTVLGGLICFTSIGSMSVGAVTTPYYLSYLQNIAGSKAARYANTLYYGTFTMIFNAIAAIVFGLLKKKLGYTLKQMLFVGSLIWGSGYFAAAYAITKSIYLYGAAHSFFFGVGLGMSYIVPVSLVTQWFPEQKGKATAIIFVGFGLGSLIFPEFATYYINPSNLSPDKPFSEDYPDEKYYTNKELLDKVPTFYLIMGCSSIFMNMVGLCLMSEIKTEVVDSKKINDDEEICNDDDKNKLIDTENGKYPQLTFMEAIKIKDVYIISLIFAFASISLSTFNSQYKNFGLTFIPDDQFLTQVYVIGSLINIPGRLLWGLIIDKLSFKISYLVVITSCMVITFTVCYNQLVPSPYNKGVYLIFYILTDFISLGAMIIQPKVYINRFGHNNLIMIHGLIRLIMIPGSLIETAIAPPLLKNVGYFWTFIITNIFPAIAFITMVFYKAKDTTGKDI